MKAAEYHALQVGDIVTIKAIVIGKFDKGTLGNHRGWFEAVLKTDGMIGEQKITMAAHDAEIMP